MVWLTPFLISRWSISGSWHQKPHLLATPILEYLKNIEPPVSGYLWGSLAPTTRQMYTTGEKQFILFCLKHGLVTPITPLHPAREVTLIYFVSHSAEFVKYHTIKEYLAAIQNLQVEFNCNLNFATLPRLHSTLCGIKHALGLSRCNLQPVTLCISFKLF